MGDDYIMSQTLHIRAFFFNAKTDYLPYYKNFTLTVDADATAKDMLELIQEQNSDFSYPKQKLIMKINSLVVEAKEPVSNIVEKLGTELLIEPANSYRSNNALRINDNDFMASYALLDPYATEADLKYYKTLYALHYASETENFDREYIGDAILLLTAKMIEEGSEYKKEILHAITSARSGLFNCEYENNLFNAQDLTKTIETLKEMVRSPKDEHPSLLDMIKARFGSNNKAEETEKKEKRERKTIEALNEKYIAYYIGAAESKANLISQIILDIGAKEIQTTRQNKLSGLSILKENKELALTKAGTTLLDAYDAGAEILVVEDEATYEMFETHFKEIENIIGRKIIGLDLITTEDFTAQVRSLKA